MSWSTPRLSPTFLWRCIGLPTKATRLFKNEHLLPLSDINLSPNFVRRNHSFVPMSLNRHLQHPFSLNKYSKCTLHSRNTGYEMLRKLGPLETLYHYQTFLSSDKAVVYLVFSSSLHVSPLDIRYAMKQIVDYHPLLRTSIALDKNGSYVYVNLKNFNIPHQETNWCKLNDVLKFPFPWKTEEPAGPLWQMFTFRHSMLGLNVDKTDTHLFGLCLAFHHCVADLKYIASILNDFLNCVSINVHGQENDCLLTKYQTTAMGAYKFPPSIENLTRSSSEVEGVTTVGSEIADVVIQEGRIVREWMTRSYSLTDAITIFREYDQIDLETDGGTGHQKHIFSKQDTARIMQKCHTTGASLTSLITSAASIAFVQTFGREAEESKLVQVPVEVMVDQRRFIEPRSSSGGMFQGCSSFHCPFVMNIPLSAEIDYPSVCWEIAQSCSVATKTLLNDRQLFQFLQHNIKTDKELYRKYHRKEFDVPNDYKSRYVLDISNIYSMFDSKNLFSHCPDGLFELKNFEYGYGLDGPDMPLFFVLSSVLSNELRLDISFSSCYITLITSTLFTRNLVKLLCNTGPH